MTTKNEIFEKIKNDKTIIYGEPIFDVFLKVTSTIAPDDLLSLSSKELDKLSEMAIYRACLMAYTSATSSDSKVGIYRYNYFGIYGSNANRFNSNDKELSKILDFLIKNKRELSGELVLYFLGNLINFSNTYNKLGNNINNLSGEQIVTLIKIFIDEKSQEKLDQLFSSDLIELLQKKENFAGSLMGLIPKSIGYPYLEKIENFEKLVDKLGGEESFIKKFAADAPSTALPLMFTKLLRYVESLDFHYDNYENYVFKFFLKNSVKYNLISSRAVVWILTSVVDKNSRSNQQSDPLNIVSKLLGENIYKLDDDQIYEILSFCHKPSALFAIGDIFGEKNINKLNPEQIRRLLSNYISEDSWIMVKALVNLIKKYYKRIDLVQDLIEKYS
jgi:hypothetical protein